MYLALKKLVIPSLQIHTWVDEFLCNEIAKAVFEVPLSANTQ